MTPPAPSRTPEPAEPMPSVEVLSLFDQTDRLEPVLEPGPCSRLPYSAEPCPEADDGSPNLPEEFGVRVIRSPRRRKSIQARLVDGVIELRVPQRASQAEVDSWTEEMRQRFDRSSATAEIDLTARAGDLAKALDLPVPTSVRWVSNQTHRWGSCTVNDGTIRLSDRLVRYPLWVIDYVLAHEMAHLVHADHSPAFWALVDRYPQAAEAKGYLTAKSDGL